MSSFVEVPATPLRKPKYKECLKNHAVGIEDHAVDGCSEFMVTGMEGSLDALKCASCNCHQNFHRKETEGTTEAQVGYLYAAHPQQQRPPLALLSNSGSGGRSGSKDELEDYYSNPSSSVWKKRFWTKFTQEQKDKMLNLAERLGWKIQKQDEELVQ
ncbi:Zinc-finger homeodomain protein 2 [Forsythia ovata]|uniref:Zinc-finger homeodomain protein 2 n=1 Tax=Forsythia ovata TaxID=205694 RepID=A0ABD1QD20_9LAMI